MKSIFIPALFLAAAIHAQTLFDDNAPHRRQRTYDVIHYKLILGFDEGKKQVTGTTQITLSPLASALDTVILDAVGLDVAAISSSRGAVAGRTQSDSELVIILERPITPLDTITLSIDYSCRPEQGLYFIQPDSSDPNNRRQIWTQGEESENRHWFPCYDFPDDKATSEIIATVRERFTLLSNGRLVAETHDATNGTRTFHWAQSKPHSSYLIMLAAGEYTVLREFGGDIPLLYYVYPERAQEAPLVFSNTARMMEFFQNEIGFPYPWEKFAQIFIDEFMWGGMENTSAVTLNELYMYDARARIDFSPDGVVAHELAHQWWGDVVTCKDWSHLWLNEGFANYYEAAFRRYHLGEDEHLHEAYTSSQSVRNAEESLGRKAVVSKESYGVNLYQKGSWVLRMLKDVIGEEQFQKAILHYITKHQFTSVSTEDFARSVEESTGEHLDWFFDQWVYKGGHPRLSVISTWDESAKLLRISVEQKQTLDSLTGLFRFPLTIECTTSRGPNLTRVWVEQQEDGFVIPLDERPSMVIVNKGLNVLMTLTYPKTRSEYRYQLHNAKDVPDRLDALKALEGSDDDFETFQMVKWSAFNDRFWAVRANATRELGAMNREGIKRVLFEICQDNDSRVRNAAVTALGRLKAPSVAAFLDSVARHDSSYVVVTTCLRSLAAMDSSRGFALASACVDQSSYTDMVRRASFEVMRLAGDSRAIPFAIKYAISNARNSTRTLAIGVLRETGKHDEQARETVSALASDPNPSVRSASVRALQHWGAGEFRDLLEKRKVVETDAAVKRAIEEALELD